MGKDAASLLAKRVVQLGGGTDRDRMDTLVCYERVEELELICLRCALHNAAVAMNMAHMARPTPGEWERVMVSVWSDERKRCQAIRQQK